MSKLTILKRQHTEVAEILNSINNLINKGNLDSTAKDITYNLNTLAGKLKMHLLSEDKFLYPNLMGSDNESITNIAHTLNNKMGEVANIFSFFVQQYNIPIKILQAKEDFQKYYNTILNIVTHRINKEDLKLYPLLEA